MTESDTIQKLKRQISRLEKENRELSVKLKNYEASAGPGGATSADVCGKRELDRQLQQSQKLQEIGTLASGIAHDFNNILSAIIGFADLVKDDTPRDSIAYANIEQILKAGNRAKKLIQHILVFSRQYDRELRPVQVHYIIEEALNLLRASIPATIEIKSVLQSKGIILGDPTQLHQVLVNLCTNAAQAMKKKGVLEVSLVDEFLGPERIDKNTELRPGLYVKLMVRDSGAGIDRSIINLIFEPYFTTKTAGDGTGMGLSVAHGIVRSFQGEITVESQPGRGTVFSVYLPAIDTECEAPVNGEYQKGAAKGNETETILLVDDEDDLIAMGKLILERHGYKVITETCSRKAVDLFKTIQDSIDLVVTDQTMPGLTGAELAREVLRLKPQMPIILCTGYSTSISEESAKAIGIREFIMKPFIKEDFLLAVRKLLDEQ